MTHFENPIHTVLIFNTTAVFNSTVLGSKSSKLPTPRNIYFTIYLMYFPSFFPQILLSSFCRNFFFLLVTYPSHNSCFGQYRGYPTSNATQFFFSQWVTELETSYFRQDTFEFNLILCMRTHLNLTSFYVWICKGSRHMTPLLQPFKTESTSDSCYKHRAVMRVPCCSERNCAEHPQTTQQRLWKCCSW